ncbi:hypothetical protein D3C75_993240 [compost metagenome]
MNIKPNTQELKQSSINIGLEIVLMDDGSSNHYIKKVIEKFKPFKITGHLSIGQNTIPLDENEFIYSNKLKNEPAYIFFDQEGCDKNSVVIVKDASQLDT